jgi:hypothetical protein
MSLFYSETSLQLVALRTFTHLLVGLITFTHLLEALGIFTQEDSATSLLSDTSDRTPISSFPVHRASEEASSCISDHTFQNLDRLGTISFSVGICLKKEGLVLRWEYLLLNINCNCRSCLLDLGLQVADWGHFVWFKESKIRLMGPR